MVMNGSKLPWALNSYKLPSGNMAVDYLPCARAWRWRRRAVGSEMVSDLWRTSARDSLGVDEFLMTGCPTIKDSMKSSRILWIFCSGSSGQHENILLLSSAKQLAANNK